MFSSCGQFFSKIAGKRVAVIGIGVSNRPLIDLLVQKGALVTACDRKERDSIEEDARRLESMGVELRLGEGYLNSLTADLVFKTPGMRCDEPRLLDAARRGAVITSEMEVFFAVCPCKIFAVTGSDGKSTTTTLIAQLLKQSGRTVHVGGNLGKPLLPEIERIETDHVAVLELSSFQLHTMKRSPQVAVITNLSPNHLDWHTSMQEYVEAKTNIFLHQDAGDLLVLNADNAGTREFIGRQIGRLTLFSSAGGQAEFTADADRSIYRNGELLLRRDEILLRGDHNIENMMAAIAAVWEDVSLQDIQAVARTFGGLEHRIEPVRELDGVSYYNDSIASSPTRTMACLAAFTQPLVLLLGGYDKKLPFDELGEELCRKARLLLLTGDTAAAIEQAVRTARSYREGSPEILRCADLPQAVTLAQEYARPGDAVILSPACASFDRYANFMQRGNHFKQLVLDLHSNTTANP